MQDRTINNALLALYRRGECLDHVEALMRARGVVKPTRMHDRQLSRGKCRRLILAMLPCTTSEVADRIQETLPGITRKSAGQRAYMALKRLEASGVVVLDCERDGFLWRKIPQS